MKKVLSLVLALVLVLGMIPTFAVGTGADELKANGFISGNESGDLLVDQALTREQLAALTAELAGDKELAAIFEQPAVYADADMISSWAVPFVAYAQEMGWMKGIAQGTETVFKPMDVVTGPELAATLMNALGYTVDSAAKYATVIADAAALGIELPTGALTRGDAFEAMWVAVSEVNMNGSDMTLGVFLGRLEPTTPVVTELKVDSVVATNLKEVIVTFNQEVDSATVVNANFVVKKGTATVATTATLLEDGKTVALAVTAANTGLDNQAAYTLEVKAAVKNVAGEAFTAETFAFSAFDATLPEVKSIKVTGPRSLELMFSEPIKGTTGVVTVKEGTTTLAVNPTFTFNDSNVVSVQLYSNMVDGKTYDVSVKEFKDFADYNNVVTTIQLPYVKDTTPPVASVTKAEQSYVVVEFDKPVTGLSKDHFYHTFSAWTALGVYSDAAMTTAVNASTAYSKVYVQFYDATLVAPASNLNRPLPEGNVTFYVRPTANSLTIKDRWENTYGEQVFTLAVAADKVVPAVTSVEVVSEKSFKVKFNKDVTFAASNVEVLKTDGTAIAGTTITVATTNAKEYTVDFAKAMPGETILINIKNVEDTTLLKNKLALYSTTLAITDKVGPTVSRVDYKVTVEGSTTTRELFVVFNEALDPATALVASNYFIDNSPAAYIPLTGTPTFFGTGNKIVRIPVTAAQAAEIVTGTDKLFVVGVKDVAGNAITPSLTTVNAIASSAPTVDTAVATGLRTVVVTFNQFVSGLTDSEIVIEVNNVAQTISSLSLGMNADGLTVATVTVAADLPYDAALLTVTVAADAVENEFGTKNLVVTDAVVDDKIAPAVAKFASNDANSALQSKSKVQRTAVDTIVITFTEDLKVGVLSNITFSVENADVTAATLNNDEITLTFAAQAGKTIPTFPKVTQNVKLMDVEGNEMLLTAPITAVGVNVTGLTVAGAGAAITITTDGGTLQMSATAAPVWSAKTDVTWTVAPLVGGSATISATGLLTAVGNGTVTVTATATDGSGVTGTLVITISGQ